ncbi:hypothetical protein D3C80_1260000 [compost metagenome]
MPITRVPMKPATPMVNKVNDNVAISTCVTVSRNGRRYVNKENCPIKNNPQAARPTATTGLAKRRKTEPVRFSSLSAGIVGKLNHCQTKAITATGTIQKNAPRQPMTDPR